MPVPKLRLAVGALLPLLPALALAHGVGEGDRQAMVAGGNLEYLVLGARHMLTGYDHLLFLFGVLPSRMFLANGFETQSWALRDGAWKLVHMHWSFPGR